MGNTELSVDISIEIAKRLKQLRKEKGLSLEQLSAEVNKQGGTLSHDSLLNYEASSADHSKYGKNLGMRIENLIVLAKIFNVSADYLLCLSDVRNPDSNAKAAVEYTGLDENNILLLHMLSTGKGTSEDTETINGSEMSQTIHGLYSMDPTICKQGHSLIDKIVSTMRENLRQILVVYNEIVYFQQQMHKQEKHGYRATDIINLNQLKILDESGFQIVESTWIAKRSWEELMGILQTGVNKMIKKDICDGKYVKRFNNFLD